MTRYDPSLFLSRLLVHRGGLSVFDETFHLRSNVIRGENGSGKSTIASFIAFSLGQDRSRWNKHAGLCDTVTAEVNINGSPLTLQRDVSEESRRPMRVYWGPYADSQKADASRWELYPFAATEQKRSFSQVLFEALSIPEVRAEATQSRVTMNQLLRLMYVDQRSTHVRIFIQEEFDRAATRDAVGQLLCGTFDNQKYLLQERQRSLRKEADRIDAQLKAALDLLGPERRSKSAEILRVERRACISERDTAVIGLRTADSSPETLESVPRQRQIRDAERRLASAQDALKAIRSGIRESQFEVEDTADFIRALDQSIEALSDSTMVRDTLGTLHFALCPSCLSPLERDVEESTCSLCKSPLETESKGGHHAARMRRELVLQAEESRGLLESSIGRLEELTSRLPEVQFEQRRAQDDYEELVGTTRTRVEEAIITANRRVGYLEREIEVLQRDIDLAASIEKLTNSRAAIASEQQQLTEELRVLQSRERRDSTNIYNRIREILASILTRDIATEHEFQRATAERVDFDFGRDRIEVDGRSEFSDSSMVVLKNAFHAALLFASIEEPKMRYPRFLLMDNIEDKGMTPKRSHNFQEVISEMSAEAESDHQLIFTTSMISPKLEGTDAMVARSFTTEKKSLSID